MKFPLSWLRRYLDTDADADTIAGTLTRIGLEVESVTNPADALRPFVIARVLSARPHPQADRLQLLEVEAADNGAPVQVVCGAPNARAGLLGVFGPPGAYVPGSGMVLKAAEIRGVASAGMMCSARELMLGDDHDGIIELPADAPVGAAYAAWAGLDDPVFDVAITPNRQDCMGVFGIARDLAAAGTGRLRALEVPALGGGYPSPVTVAVDDLSGCAAFFARHVRGVRNGPSPAWLQALLRGAGLRPISMLVDVTNYFTIGHGRPLHVFDAARLSGGLVARRARPGETLAALNGRTYTLDDSMTVIADAERAHGIAGIMGGAESAVSETTTDVVIECAWFDPARIGATGRKLGLGSDARQRFERGVDPAFVGPGLDLAAAMIVALGGGEVSARAEAGAPPLLSRTIAFAPERTQSLGGIAVAAGEQRAILERLGFTVDSGWNVTVPSWRRDIDGAADLVEEVVRMVGLDAVTAVALPRAEGVARPTATAAQLTERRLRRLMASRGLAEAIVWSFIPEAQAALFGGHAHALENPLSAELAVMRPSLLPGMVAAAARNAARAAPAVALFQTGRRYLAEGERPTLGILVAGEAQPTDWRLGRGRAVDAFDVKGHVLAALAAAGAPVERLQTVQPAAPHYHPGRSARLMLGKVMLAEFGELHPEVASAFDLGLPVAAAEVFLDALPERRVRRSRPPFAPPPLQPLARDYAFLVPESLAAEALVRAVAGADRSLIADVRLFDRFAGAGVPAGEVSLALTVTLQPRDRTLTESDLDALTGRIVAAAGKLGARLRG